MFETTQEKTAAAMITMAGQRFQVSVMFPSKLRCSKRDITNDKLRSLYSYSTEINPGYNVPSPLGHAFEQQPFYFTPVVQARRRRLYDKLRHGETPAFNACGALDPTQVSDAGGEMKRSAIFFHQLKWNGSDRWFVHLGQLCGSCARRPLPGSSEFSV